MRFAFAFVCSLWSLVPRFSRFASLCVLVVAWSSFLLPALRSGLSPFPPFVSPACVPLPAVATLAGLHTVGSGRSVRSRPLTLHFIARLRLLLSRVLRPLLIGSGIAPLFMCSLRFALLPTKVGLAPASYARSLPFLATLGGGSFTRPPLAFLRGRARPPVRLNPATAVISQLVFSTAYKRYFADETI